MLGRSGNVATCSPSGPAPSTKPSSTASSPRRRASPSPTTRAARRLASSQPATPTGVTRPSSATRPAPSRPRSRPCGAGRPTGALASPSGRRRGHRGGQGHRTASPHGTAHLRGLLPGRRVGRLDRSLRVRLRLAPDAPRSGRGGLRRSRDPATRSVRFEVTAFSNPSHLLLRLAPPISRAAQLTRHPPLPASPSSATCKTHVR